MQANAAQSMNPQMSSAMYGGAVQGFGALSNWGAKEAQVMAMFHGYPAGQFGTDQGMSPAYRHEFTLQSLIGARSILQERLFIRRSLNPLKVGLRVLAPLVLVNALKIAFERREDLPVLISHGAERTTGRGTQRRSEMREEQLERWMGGDQFGIDALAEDPSILDSSRAINVDGLLSSLDFNVWAEARRAHDMTFQQDAAMYKNNGVSSVTTHMLEQQQDRFMEFTFAFHRYDAVMTRLTNQIEMWQQQYGGAGDTWFLHLFSDLAMRNANTGEGKEWEYFRYGPGALERRTAALGETLPAAVSGKQVYLMSSTDIAGVRGLDVMERAMTYGEAYVQGYPNCQQLNGAVQSSDADIYLMTVNNGKTMWNCWSLLDSLDACGMYDVDGTPIDIINGDRNDINREQANAAFPSAADRRHSLYYLNASGEQCLVKFMGQLEQWSFSTRSLLKLTRSVVARMQVQDANQSLAKLAAAIKTMKRPAIGATNVVTYLNAWKHDKKEVKAKDNKGGGLTALVANMKEFDRNSEGGWDLPRVAALTGDPLAQPAGTIPADLGFALPPMGHSWGVLRTIANARAGNGDRASFQSTYGLSFEAASDVADGVRALESISESLERLLPGSIFNDANYAPDYVWNPTNAAALYAATIGADSVPLFAKSGTGPTGTFSVEAKHSEAANLGNEYAAAVQDRFTGRMAVGTGGSHLIQANINAAVDDDDQRIVRTATATQKLAKEAIKAGELGVGKAVLASTYSAEAEEAIGLAYRSLLALMFNTRSASTDKATILRAERNRALLLVLAGAIKAGELPAAEQAANINKFMEHLVKPAYGELSYDKANGTGNTLFGANDEGLETLRRNINLKIRTKELEGVFSPAEIQAAAVQVAGIYDRYQALTASATSTLEPVVSPGAWRRTPLMVGREQFLSFKDDKKDYLPADPSLMSRVIPLNVLAVAQAQVPDQLPAVFLTAAELRARVPDLGVARHFQAMLSGDAALNRDAVDPFTGLTYGEELARLDKQTGADNYDAMDVGSGALMAVNPADSVQPGDFASLVSRSFKQHWVGVSVGAQSLLEEMVAKVFMGQVHTKQVLRAAAINDTLFPMRFLLARFLQLSTISALYAMRGGLAMQTPFTAPRFYQGQTVSTQEFSYNFHVWAKPVVLNQDYLYWVDHVQIRRYLGGWSLRPALPKAVRDVTGDSARFHEAGDVFVMVQPFENTPYPGRFPITGRRDHYAPSVPSDVASNTEAVYPNAYATELLFGFSAIANGYTSDEAVVPDGNSTWHGAVQRVLPNLFLGTALFHTQHGNFIQHSSGPLESKFVNNDMYTALVEGKDRFRAVNLDGYQTSQLTIAPRGIATF